MHRDVKPENIMINDDGYSVLIDFGMAKILDDEGITHTFCGIPLYMAPEFVKGKGYGVSVDWWSLGIILYEMLQGRVPFTGSNQIELFISVVKRKYLVPPDMDEDAQVIIAGLLARNKKRLGCLQGGANDVRENDFFSSISCNALFYKKLSPPWKPEPSSESTEVDLRVSFTDISDETAKLSIRRSRMAKYKQFESFSEY